MNSSETISEFDIIARFFSDVGTQNNHQMSSVALGIGDDCTLLSIADGQQLAMSLDTLVAGRHFPVDANPSGIGFRLLAVAVSDLAAMGASPLAFTLALTMPGSDVDWLEKFSRGLRQAADEFSIPLVGGDTTQGPLTLSVQVHGTVSAGRALTRSGAAVGDAVFVSGTLGDAAAALAVIEDRLDVDSQQRAFFMSRFYQPTARLALGEALIGVASAAIDISDGLLADLGHIVKASNVAARINTEVLPFSPAMHVVSKEQATRYALNGGDDYELCFTVAANKRKYLQALSERLGITITEIGEIVDGAGVVCVDQAGNELTLSSSGYQHFK